MAHDAGPVSARVPRSILSLLIRFRWKSGDADSGMAFMSYIEADEERRDLLDDAGVLEFASVDGTHARNLRREFARQLSGVGIIAADYDVAVERRVSI